MVKLVNWHKFDKEIKGKKLYLFGHREIMRLFGLSQPTATKLLHRYYQKRFITRLKRDMYTISDFNVPELYLANRLYAPSYISLEFALSYHRVIPENVYEITSVTTKATRRFRALGKNFSYRKIKREAFAGYASVRRNNITFLIAEPEKAFVDLLYFRLRRRQKPITRFSKEKLNRARAIRYAKSFNSDKLVSIISTSLR